MAQQTLGQPRVVVSDAFTHAANGTTVRAVELPAKSWVPPCGVTLYVAEAFAGGTPSLDVGDVDTDGWVDTTEIDETTIGCYTGVAAALAIAGKYYASADTIDVTVADTTLTAGTGYVIVTYYDMSGVDLTAQ